jgi:hypothetical protein
MFDRVGNMTQVWAAWFRGMYDRSGGTSETVAEHIADGTDAHDASAISNVPNGNLSATNAQAALNELQGDIDTINAAIGSLEGDSAYQVAVNNGFVGTEAQWLDSLVGPTGPTGPTGSTGPQGVQGVQGPEGPPGGSINTNFAVSNTGFIYSNSLTGHVYLLEVAS